MPAVRFARFLPVLLFCCSLGAQTPSAALPTLWIVGDSTASNTGRKGWGDPVADYFDPAKVQVLNRARAGRSARTYFNEGLWEGVASGLKAGDYVLIQFGHNDGGDPGKAPFRGDVPGLSDESRDVILPDGHIETVHTFGWYIRRFLEDSKARGAHPVLLSPTVRNIWKDGRIEREMGQFAKWSQTLAETARVPFIDFSNIAADYFEKLGPQQTAVYFPVDHTHTSPEGADVNARLVVEGLKGIRSPVAQWVSAKGDALAAAPSLANLHLPVPADPRLPTVFLIGDSTVRNGHGDGADGQWGWGEPVFGYFDPAKANLVNRAVGGLSSRTFYTGPYWEKVLAMIKPGDFVVMQFGHNDGGALDGPQGYRVTLKGTGTETADFANKDGSHETVHTYGWYLARFVQQARDKGATPLICSLVPRKTWKDGRIARNSGDYGKWAADVAREQNTPFLDLNEIIARRYDQLGPAQVDPLFADPHTHTSRAGAELNAEAVVSALKALNPNPLAGFLSGKAAGVRPFTP